MPQILYETKVDEDKFKRLEQIARQRHKEVSTLIDQAIDEILRRYFSGEDSVVERTFGVYQIPDEDVQYVALNEELSYDL